jgi:hypothetical protein
MSSQFSYKIWQVSLSISTSMAVRVSRGSFKGVQGLDKKFTSYYNSATFGSEFGSERIPRLATG